MNTVDAAQRLYRQLAARTENCTLLHARFRGIERAERLAAVLGEPGEHGGGIVVTTQVVEAGLDLDAAVLVTETAPWPSLIQRVGLCNRSGQLNADAEVWWLPPPNPFPYQQEDIDAAARELGRLEGERLTTEDLTARDVPLSRGQITVIRRADLDGLFDTSPDPSGNDVDIAPYVQDAEDLDVEVAWATWTPGDDGAPDLEIRVPAAEYRCRVPVGEVVAFARDRAVWRFDRSADGWTRISEQPHSRPRPGEVLLVSADDGGYGVETGFDPSAPGPVPGSPELLTPEEWQARVALAAAEAALAVGPGLAADAALTAEALADADEDPEEAEPGAGNRWTSTASRSAIRRRRCSPSSPRGSRPRPRAAWSSPATCTTSARRTRSGRTRSAPWLMKRRGPRSSRPPVGQVGRERPAAVRRRRRLPPRARVPAADRRPAGRAASGIPGPRPHQILGPRPPRQAPPASPRAPTPGCTVSSASPVGPAGPAGPAGPSRWHATARGPPASQRHPRPPSRRDDRRPGHARPARHHAHRRP